MSVRKIIFRSCMNTLAAIFILLVFMVGMLVAVYPETMMNISYDMGMEKSCVWFAERAYKRHNKIDTIAFATSVAVEQNMYGKVVTCGEQMIADNEFAVYCDFKDKLNHDKYGDLTIGGTPIVEIIGTYDQYVYAQVSIARYKLGDKDGALERAVNAVELTAEFPRNNAFASLLLEVYEFGDEDFLQTLLLEMDDLYRDGWADGSKDYFNDLRVAVSG
ncbi:MAG: hypothetical protein E7352_02500 [Clostridiales bacterium]|nr:hypothetical protein [Clostridiales bacterium]